MAALSVIDGGMGCVEDPSHEAAASQQSTEDWAKVTWASDSSQEEGEEIEKVASVDDLADCIKESVKPFAKQIIQVLEKRQERLEYKSNSFSEACAQLKDVCQSCDQQDRLIIAGSDNVGKSTIANALLGGGKFWPTASVCMTSRICEAHYNASSDGQPISKDLVQKGVTSGSEESHCMQKPLQVFHPSPLLKPDVILVDLPGLDQEREYMDRLEGS
jgi:ribosome biogenesis GTPase A